MRLHFLGAATIERACRSALVTFFFIYLFNFFGSLAAQEEVGKNQIGCLRNFLKGPSFFFFFFTQRGFYRKIESLYVLILDPVPKLRYKAAPSKVPQATKVKFIQ